jgi:hypothetical protein
MGIQRQLRRYLKGLGLSDGFIRPIAMTSNLHYCMNKYRPAVLFIDQSWLQEANRLGISLLSWLSSYYEAHQDQTVAVFLMSDLKLPVPLGDALPANMKVVMFQKPFGRKQFLHTVAPIIEPVLPVFH